MGGETVYRPGEGTTATVYASLHSGNIAAIRARVGKRGFSAYVDAAVQRQIERDNLAELTAALKSEHGAFSPAEIAAARALLRGDADGGVESAA